MKYRIIEYKEKEGSRFLPQHKPSHIFGWLCPWKNFEYPGVLGQMIALSLSPWRLGITFDTWDKAMEFIEEQKQKKRIVHEL